jgi:Family of unknown function (DUF6069)
MTAASLEHFGRRLEVRFGRLDALLLTLGTADGSNTLAPSDQHHRGLVRAGAVAGLAAAGATMAIAALARGLDVPLEAGSGTEIPVLGFGQLTLFFTAIGVLIAHMLRRRAARPRAAFVRVTVVLTALSLVPDAVLSTDAATKVTLALSHIVAAVIVIPPLVSCLPPIAERKLRCRT